MIYLMVEIDSKNGLSNAKILLRACFLTFTNVSYVKLALLVHIREVEVAVVLVAGLAHRLLLLLLAPPTGCPASPPTAPPTPPSHRTVLVRLCRAGQHFFCVLYRQRMDQITIKTTNPKKAVFS
jgi:hypothetical protein